MKRKIIPTNSFKKDLKRIVNQGKDLQKLKVAVDALANDKALDINMRDHLLKGNFAGYMECHIEPDWLLIYKKSSTELILTLTRTGSHSDLFKK